MLLLGALAGLVTAQPSMIYGNGLGAFLVTPILLAVAAIALIAFAVVNSKRHTVASLVMLISFAITAWISLKISYEVHSIGRWLAHSKQYKAEVAAQAEPANGELKHIEWDVWGFAGTDTFAYLVFDPNDQLTSKSSKASGKFVGIPCEIWRTRRLETHWYYVVFYTNTSWDRCS